MVVKKSFIIACSLCFIFILGSCMSSTKSDDITPTQISQKKTVAEVDGTVITQEDFDQYSSAIKAYNKLLLLTIEVSAKSGNTYANYQYDQAQYVLDLDDKGLLKQYLKDIIVSKKAQEHVSNSVDKQEEINSIQNSIQEMFLALSKDKKKEVMEISQKSSENLINTCFSYYAEILYNNTVEYNYFLNNEFTGDPMPEYAETEKYLTEFEQWAINAQKQFEQYKEKLVGKSHIKLY